MFESNYVCVTTHVRYFFYRHTERGSLIA